MTLKERQEILMGIIVRVIKLHEENERLKKEVSSRRHQADVWRKKAQKMHSDLEAVRIYIGPDKTIANIREEVGFKL